MNSNLYRISSVIFLAALCLASSLLFSSCDNPCPLNKITLTNFWHESLDRNIGIDPLGGFIFFYWVDDKGNVSHGEPGVSGQPGPYVITAFSQEAYNAAQANAVISEDQMKQFQEFIYANENYHVGGYHFAQFDNIIWRNRADGKVFIDRISHYFSKPVIISAENTVCLTPVYAAQDEACAKYSGFILPALFGNNQQHPSIGLSRLHPANTSLNEKDLMNYCVLKLPHGLDISE